jgi:hypothetical protein
VPAEGQWRRQQRTIALTRRDRGLLAAVACVLVIGTGGAVYAGVHASGSDRAPAIGSGCIEATVPGSTGASILRTCGTSAQSLCLTEGARGDAVAATLQSACRRAGLPLHAPAPGAGP